MDLTPKQQTSEAIRQADSILILTGQHPSVDQMVAVLSLAMILRKFGKQVSAVISDSLPNAVNVLDTAIIEQSLGGSRDFILKVDVAKAEVDKLRYEMADGKLNVIITPYKGSFGPGDVTFDYGQPQARYDIVMVLGVPTRARIDQVYAQNASLFADVPVINLDFHRTNENYGAVNLIDSNASSLCEILVALSESLQSGIIDADIATPLLMGLVASTDRFTATHTTSKSLTVAAQMMAAGAKQQAVVRALYRDGGNRNAAGRNDGREAARNDNRDNRREQPASRPADIRRESPAPTRPAETVRPAETTQPVSQPAAPAADVPIIAPGHIEMMSSSAEAVDAVEPVIARPQPVDTRPQPVAPGQLPPEMSPLVDLGMQPTAVHPDQAALNMPMPSSMRNDA